jgi:hypothetical protein
VSTVPQLRGMFHKEENLPLYGAEVFLFVELTSNDIRQTAAGTTTPFAVGCGGSLSDPHGAGICAFHCHRADRIWAGGICKDP